MFRLWGKIFKDNHMLRDTVIENDRNDTRTHKIFDSLDQICYDFDLGKPIWLDSNIQEFKRHSKTRFYQDSFIEQINFDFFVISNCLVSQDFFDIFIDSVQQSFTSLFRCPGNMRRNDQLAAVLDLP